MKFKNITHKELREVIRKLALEKTAAKRSPHPVYWYYLDGKKVLRVTMPGEHGGSGRISTGFLNGIKDNLKLTSQQLANLAECPLTGEGFKEIIRAKLNLR